MFLRALRVACTFGLVSLGLASACGGSSSSDAASDPAAGSSGHGNGGHGGSGGNAGKSATGGAPPSMKCGTATCNAVVLPIGDFAIPPCCADEATSQCGLDSSVLSAFGPTFSDACQPLHQAGVMDGSCEASAKTPIVGTTLEIQFPGCCRDNGTCGYQLDRLGFVSIGLGCVESAPFLDGGTPASCGNVGAGGESGAASGGSSGSIEPGAAGAAGDGGAGT